MSTDKPTQNNRLLEHFHQGLAITALESWQRLGIMRLAARVFDLREAGVDIRDKLIEVNNRWGEKVHVKEYRIAGANDEAGTHTEDTGHTTTKPEPVADHVFVSKPADLQFDLFGHTEKARWPA